MGIIMSEGFLKSTIKWARANPYSCKADLASKMNFWFQKDKSLNKPVELFNKTMEALGVKNTYGV